MTASVGIAQINIERMGWLQAQRVATRVEELLDPCTNLRAAQAILMECWARESLAPPHSASPSPLHRTLSCYNAGNPTTGLRNGYVQRVSWAAQRSAPVTTPSLALPKPIR
jgi:type IV secretion system protein VirB1